MDVCLFVFSEIRRESIKGFAFYFNLIFLFVSLFALENYFFN